jgi:hypothetical protein
MQRQGEETHFETDEARAASSPNIVRWVLGISLFAAIALLSVIWITGAATQDESESYVTVPATDQQANSDGDSTDSIIGENADRLEAAEVGDTAEGQPTVENEGSDAPAPTAT